ncbi:putative linoleate diol synthase [Lentinula edodes]|uniref:putative linoleate diol synthase n=1 Tax=Lentinula edodes TaxID=5353 RepID=UPI001E8D5FB0|nr:putative linoleate diol synthase [Lentinula edodes]KAH7870565.1 putative linoleate diol synthase [Lentinula edodes]
MSEATSPLDKFPSIFRRSTSIYPNNGTANGHQAKADSTTTFSPAQPFKKANTHLTFEQSGLSAAADFVRHKEAIDDRKLALEHGLSLLSKLPPGDFAQKLQDDVIKLLYNDLSHPPATLIGNKYAWRSADGSGNNIGDPDLGKAGATYARSVQQSHPLSPSELPDPGLIFDTLLKRDGFQSHPAGLSSLMFSFAALVIHSVFRTSHTDVNINETSSYCDLAPLYGHNQETQDRVRRKEGLGLLHPDSFAEDRLLLLPPAVCVLLVLFSRNHNYIAKKLFDINERKKYKDPSTLSGDALAAQDEELFQTARLVNCGWFGTVIFSDYVSCILGLVRQGSNWSLDPFGEMRNSDHSEFERGRGNSCSVEFNCLYRWHATTSQEDEQWTLQKLQQIFPDKPIEDLTAMDFVIGAKKAMAQLPDLSHWTFGDLKRQEDGSFRDEDLANLLKNATEHPAGAFRARGTPECMRLHEIMGITQNRAWGVCSLNDFRKYLGLKPYSTFLEWNSNPEIAHAAEKLYGNIEYLELYVGLQAEEAKPVVDGAGLCPGYTISRAILSDAIALTRGDRYFTHDFTPFNLTAWGFADCQRQPDAFGFGSALGRLFLRTLPEQFTENSTYAFFPLMTPQAMTVYLKDLNLSDQYDMKRPTTRNPGVVAMDYTQVGNIIRDPKFIAHYEKRAKDVVSGKGFFSAPEDRTEQKRVLGALAGTSEASAELTKFFFEKTQELIKSNSFNLSGSKTRSVNLVRDVLKLVPIHWIADLSGLKIKNSSSDDGDFTATELYGMLGDIYSYIFLDVELSKLMVLKERVQSHVKLLLEKIETGLGGSISRMLSISNILSLFRPKKTTEHIIVQHLQKLGYTSAREQGNVLLAIMVGSVELSVACTNMVDLYLDSEYEDAIRNLALTGDKEGDLVGYAREALRLDPSFKGVYRIASSDHNSDGLNIQKDGRVFLDIYAAGRNDQVFPQPDTVNARRDQSGKTYIISDGISRCLGEDITVKIMTHVLRGIFAIKDIQRAPGNSGVLNRFKDHDRPELNYAYLDENKFVTPWPNSLSVVYTDDS